MKPSLPSGAWISTGRFFLSALVAANSGAFGQGFPIVNIPLQLPQHSEANIRNENIVYPIRNRPVRFTLVAAPTTGQLEINGEVVQAGESFTASSVTSGRVTYRAFRRPGFELVGFFVEDSAGVTKTTHLRVHVTSRIKLDRSEVALRGAGSPVGRITVPGSPHGAVLPVMKVTEQLIGDERSHGVELADLDGDGDLDAFTLVTRGARIWTNQGRGQGGDEGTFAERQEIRVRGIAEDVALFDFDEDGDLDAILADAGIEDAKTWLWENDGTGAFTKTDMGFNWARSVATGDFDQDGDLDAFVESHVWHQTEPGVFTLVQETKRSRHFELEAGDLDGDGDLDIFSVTRGANLVLLNQGGWQRGRPGTFEPTDQLLSSTVGHANNLFVQLGDLDGDGDLDAFAPDSIWYNLTGQPGARLGEFGEYQQLIGEPINDVAALADFDGDGDLDAIDFPRSGSLYLNDGNGFFVAQERGVSYSRTIGLPAKMDAGDIDGDGDIDLYIATGRADRIALNVPEPHFRITVDEMSADKYEIADGNLLKLREGVSLPAVQSGADLLFLNIRDPDGNEISGSISFRYSMDADRDGLDDWWENEMLGDLTQSADGDIDRDGLTNIAERYLGTDPKRADPSPIEVARGHGGTAVSVRPARAVIEVVGRFQISEDLRLWSDVPEGSTTTEFDGNGLVDQVTLTLPPDKRVVYVRMALRPR